MAKNNSTKRALRAGILICLIIVAFACTTAAADVARISIQELKGMMDKGTPVTIIDVQPKDIYAAGHIKGAISLPYKPQIQLEDVWSLPEDRLIVTYCDCGPGEADSSDAASQLIGLGYENVKVLGDPSIKGWKASGYPMEGGK
jgi:rhodanese-related sulfurtransferase